MLELHGLSMLQRHVGKSIFSIGQSEVTGTLSHQAEKPLTASHS